MLIKPFITIAGVGPAGEIAEVSDEYGSFLVKHDKAQDASSLAVRLGLRGDPYENMDGGELEKELKARGLPHSGTKSEKKARLESDDQTAPEAPGDDTEVGNTTGAPAVPADTASSGD